MQTMELTVPEGVTAGQLVQTVTPSGPVQVTVPAGLAAGDKFQVQLQSSDAAATVRSALSQLGDLGSSVTFGLSSSRISSAGGLVNQSIAGGMPVVSAAGQDVMTLSFESLRRGKHLHATLALPNGTEIAVLDMGEPPKATVGGLFSSVATSYSTSSPPSVKLSVLGQAYGSYTATGYMNCRLQAGARWHHVDDTGGATIPEPGAGQTCCFCCMDQAVTRKASALGKKEVPLTVKFDSAEATTVHVVTDSREGPMRKPIATNVRQVVCELDKLGDDARKRLDVILIGAALAALNVTTYMPSD